MKLLKTTTAQRHYHIVYLDEQTGEGVTSVSKGHKHAIMYQQPQPEGWDVANQYVAAVEGGFIITPDDKGNTHELIEISIKEKKEKPKKDNDTVTEVKALYNTVKEQEKDSRKVAHKCEGFYDGDGQWEKTDKDTLKAEQRSALTINEIENKIDLLSGYQRQNRTDIRFFPVEDSDGRVADILNVVVKNVTEHNTYKNEETEAFEDACIAGRGLLHIYIDQDKNLEGDIVIEKYPWDQCYFGPHEKKNLADLELLVKTKWFSKAKLEQLWPDKADDIRTEYDSYFEEKDDGKSQSVTPGHQYEGSDNQIVPLDTDFVDLAKKEFRMLELWRKEYERVPVLVNPKDDFVYNALDWSKQDIASVKTIPGLRVIYRNIHKMRITKTVSNVLLEDTYDDPTASVLNDFNIIPIYAKKRGKKWWGKVKAALDPQCESNKRFSQAIDIINKMGGYGWFFDQETFAPGEENKFKKNAGKPAFTSKVKNINRTPKQVEGIKYPVEIVEMGKFSSDKLRENMGINQELLGLNSRAESGIAIQEKKRQGLIGNEFLFDNLSISKQRLGLLIVSLLQEYYRPERILRLVANQNERAPIQIGKKDLTMGGQQQGGENEISPDTVLALLENADLTRFDVSVGESAYNPTTRMANFAMWSEIAQTRPQEITAEFLIEMSDLPDKDKFKQFAAQRMQAQQQTEQAKNEVELLKSGIDPQTKQPFIERENNG